VELKIYREHFEIGYSEAAELFKASVRIVEVEISSYCNRTCSFCPNFFIDRRSAQNYMSDPLFERILEQLASIDYNGSFRVHRYNEPLADPAYALKRIGQVRSALPNAFIYLHTNADYLDSALLVKLHAAGVRGIRASAYSTKEPRGMDELEALLRSRVERLGFPYRLGRWSNIVYANVDAIDGLEFTYVATDFSVDQQGKMLGSTRGGALEVNKDYVRNSPCAAPFREFQVEWDGTLMPCCQLRSDVPVHAGAVLGRLTPQADIFSEWANVAHVRWRASMVGDGPKAGPCRTCDFATVPDEAHVRQFFASAAAYVAELDNSSAFSAKEAM